MLGCFFFFVGSFLEQNKKHDGKNGHAKEIFSFKQRDFPQNFFYMKGEWQPCADYHKTN